MSQPKLSCTKLNPNLMVSNVDASLRFYEDVLGFDRSMTFPEGSFVHVRVGHERSGQDLPQ